MISLLNTMLSYEFLLKAFVVGIVVSLCASMLGVSLVLKRYAMIGDGLSHVGFGSLAVATALNMAPLQITIPIVVLSAFLLLRISESSKIKGDSAIAMISTSALAIGVTVIALAKGLNNDLYSYMFGSILAMSRADVVLSLVLSGIVLILFVLFYNNLFAITFDEAFSRATGINVDFYNMLLAFLTAITIVLGMRIMGALLISSLIIFPALTSMRVFRHFRTVIISSAIISLLGFVFGMMISYVAGTPTGASVVIVNIFMFALFSFIRIYLPKSKL
ncbi:MAG: metal ABC transporter permease [Peptostreptococcaceae bacterium]|nr:metal ABC transporter permease [Peptostreptococcaceae bacterium]